MDISICGYGYIFCTTHLTFSCKKNARESQPEMTNADLLSNSMSFQILLKRLSSFSLCWHSERSDKKERNWISVFKFLETTVFPIKSLQSLITFQFQIRPHAHFRKCHFLARLSNLTLNLLLCLLIQHLFGYIFKNSCQSSLHFGLLTQSISSPI